MWHPFLSREDYGFVPDTTERRFANEGKEMVSGGTFDSVVSLDSDGGAICCEDNVMLKIDDCNFFECQAINGGAIYFSSPLLTLFHTSFARNHALSNGGALYITRGSLVADHSSFYQNSAQNGGAFRVLSAVVTLQSCHMFENYAEVGGILHGTSCDGCIAANFLCNNTFTDSNSALFDIDGVNQQMFSIENCCFFNCTVLVAKISPMSTVRITDCGFQTTNPNAIIASGYQYPLEQHNNWIGQFWNITTVYPSPLLQRAALKYYMSPPAESLTGFKSIGIMIIGAIIAFYFIMKIYMPLFYALGTQTPYQKMSSA